MQKSLTILKKLDTDIYFLFRELLMYSNILFDNIRDLECEIYGGPVAVEHTFERKDSFQADHPRRRQSTVQTSSNDNLSSDDIWYTMKIDSKTGALVYNMGGK